eukprot:scaffold17120_cov118-Isochrysis_galbana.AAC.3
MRKVALPAGEMSALSQDAVLGDHDGEGMTCAGCIGSSSASHLSADQYDTERAGLPLSQDVVRCSQLGADQSETEGAAAAREAEVSRRAVKEDIEERPAQQESNGNLSNDKLEAAVEGDFAKQVPNVGLLKGRLAELTPKRCVSSVLHSHGSGVSLEPLMAYARGGEECGQASISSPAISFETQSEADRCSLNAAEGISQYCEVLRSATVAEDDTSLNELRQVIGCLQRLRVDSHLEHSSLILREPENLGKIHESVREEATSLRKPPRVEEPQLYLATARSLTLIFTVPTHDAEITEFRVLVKPYDEHLDTMGGEAISADKRWDTIPRQLWIRNGNSKPAGERFKWTAHDLQPGKKYGVKWHARALIGKNSACKGEIAPKNGWLVVETLKKIDSESLDWLINNLRATISADDGIDKSKFDGLKSTLIEFIETDIDVCRLREAQAHAALIHVKRALQKTANESYHVEHLQAAMCDLIERIDILSSRWELALRASSQVRTEAQVGATATAFAEPTSHVVAPPSPHVSELAVSDAAEKKLKTDLDEFKSTVKDLDFLAGSDEHSFMGEFNKLHSLMCAFEELAWRPLKKMWLSLQSSFRKLRKLDMARFDADECSQMSGLISRAGELELKWKSLVKKPPTKCKRAQVNEDAHKEKLKGPWVHLKLFIPRSETTIEAFEIKWEATGVGGADASYQRIDSRSLWSEKVEGDDFHWCLRGLKPGTRYQIAYRAIAGEGCKKKNNVFSQPLTVWTRSDNAGERSAIPNTTVPGKDALLNAAKYAFEQYYQWRCDAAPDNKELGVTRPVHDLCNAVRKALLVRFVANAVASSQGTPPFHDDQVAAMEIAMIFESSGQQSEISCAEHPGAHQTAKDSFKSSSIKNFDEYVQLHALASPTTQNCSAALHNMWTASDDLLQAVFEVTHVLDLMRCEGDVSRLPKFENHERMLGRDFAPLAELASDAIIATGDSLEFTKHSCLHAPGKLDEEKIVLCSTDPKICITVVRKAHALRKRVRRKLSEAFPNLEKMQRRLEGETMQACIEDLASEIRYDASGKWAKSPDNIPAEWLSEILGAVQKKVLDNMTMNDKSAALVNTDGSVSLKALHNKLEELEQDTPEDAAALLFAKAKLIAHQGLMEQTLVNGQPSTAWKNLVMCARLSPFELNHAKVFHRSHSCCAS